MTRILLWHVLPGLLPFAAYGLWLWFAVRARQRDPDWRETPWVMLIVASVALVIASLVAVRFGTDAAPGSTYVPARIEDGRIVPGEYR